MKLLFGVEPERQPDAEETGVAVQLILIVGVAVVIDRKSVV